MIPNRMNPKEVVIAPPSLYLISVLEEVRKEVKVAAQNCYLKPNGAFTGEVSPAQLKDAGVPYVVLGACFVCPYPNTPTNGM